MSLGVSILALSDPSNFLPGGRDMQGADWGLTLHHGQSHTLSITLSSKETSFLKSSGGGMGALHPGVRGDPGSRCGKPSPLFCWLLTDFPYSVLPTLQLPFWNYMNVDSWLLEDLVGCRCLHVGLDLAFSRQWLLPHLFPNLKYFLLLSLLHSLRPVAFYKKINK